MSLESNLPQLPSGAKRYKNFYAVFPDGKIVSMLRANYRALKPNISSDGYHSVEIRDKSGSVKRERVNRIVCTAWNGDPFDGAICRHKDGVRDNNHHENLEWGTHSENAYDAVRHGTWVSAQNGKKGALKISGSKSHLAKLKESQVVEIRKRLKDGEMGKIIALDYGVSPSAISRINRGFGWKTA